MYTHELYTDGLGASQPVVLTSWAHEKYSRKVDLFPPKMTKGYAGHRFLVAASNQPPFVFRRYSIHMIGLIFPVDAGSPKLHFTDLFNSLSAIFGITGSQIG